MEGYQRGCTSSCEGMHELPIEQVRVHPSCRTASTLTDPRIEMGKHLHGKHHTMDPIMEGILSFSLASSRGLPPIELQLQIENFSSYIITLI
jgi:hypothetical protein